MNSADQQKRESIEAGLKSLEAQNACAGDRHTLHAQAAEVGKTVETVGDPVVKTEYRRKLSVLQGKS